MVEPRTRGLRYDLEHWNDRFVIRTNADGAIDFKLVEAPEADPVRARTGATWSPHRPGRS